MDVVYNGVELRCHGKQCSVFNHLYISKDWRVHRTIIYRKLYGHIHPYFSTFFYSNKISMVHNRRQDFSFYEFIFLISLLLRTLTVASSHLGPALVSSIHCEANSSCTDFLSRFFLFLSFLSILLPLILNQINPFLTFHPDSSDSSSSYQDISH